MHKCGNKKILFKKFTSVFYLLKKKIESQIFKVDKIHNKII